MLKKVWSSRDISNTTTKLKVYYETMVLSVFVMYNVLSGLAACGRLGVAARPACLFVTRIYSSTRPAARDQRHASHVGATPAD